MPGMSGIELKQHLSTSNVDARHHDHRAPRSRSGGKALASGAVCFLRKPFEADALIHCLEGALRS